MPLHPARAGARPRDREHPPVADRGRAERGAGAVRLCRVQAAQGRAVWL